MWTLKNSHTIREEQFPWLWLSFVNAWVGMGGPHKLIARKTSTGLLKQINDKKNYNGNCYKKVSFYERISEM